MAFGISPSSPTPPVTSDGFPDYNIQFQNDGADLGEPADIDTVNFRKGVLATRGTGESTNVVSAEFDDSTAEYTPAGDGATIRTVRDKLRERVSATDYGPLGEEASIQKAIDYLATRGGGEVLVPAAVWSISTGLTVRDSHIAIIGEGYDTRHDAGSGEQSPTALRWTGAAGGTVLDIGPTEGASAKRLVGNKVLGLAVQCENLAERGLHVRSVAYGEFELSGRNATAYLFDFGCATTLGESTDTQHCRIKLNGYQGGSTGVGFHAYGAGGGNFSYNQDVEVNIRHSTADGIVLDSADNNTFKLLRGFRSSGTSTSIIFNGAATTATCRANTFHRVSATGGLIARGTSSFANPSANNLILDYDKENANPDPTIETGATLYWRGNTDAGWIPRKGQAWTPTVSASSGTITSYSVSTARYERVGPFIYFTVAVSITDNGTGAGSLRITLPQAALYSGSCVGRNTTNLTSMSGDISPGSDVLGLRKYDGTYPVATGEGARISGFYLVA